MKNCLIVEDIHETRQWLAEIVVAAFPNCLVAEAATVCDGLRLADGGGYDLALIDLGLPDGSGLDVLRAIQHRTPDAVCVITTVMGDDAHIVAALSAGAQGYLLKEQPAELLSRQLTELSAGCPHCRRQSHGGSWSTSSGLALPPPETTT